jgi:hypothetical protein
MDDRNDIRICHRPECAALATNLTVSEGDNLQVPQGCNGQGEHCVPSVGDVVRQLARVVFVVVWF